MRRNRDGRVQGEYVMPGVQTDPGPERTEKNLRILASAYEFRRETRVHPLGHGRTDGPCLSTIYN